MTGKKALVTGVSGQDGSYLAELLLSKGYEVHGLFRTVHQRTKFEFDNVPTASLVQLHTGSIEDYGLVAECVRAVQPAECYHLAAQTFIGADGTKDFATLQTNINGTWHMLAALQEHAPKCKLFLAGSSEMFGDVSSSPQNEDSPFRPQSIYGVSKVTGYHLMRYYRETHGMHASCGILYNHESPRRGRHFVTRKITSGAAAIKSNRQQELRLGNLDDLRDWGHARDYVRAMWMMLQQNCPDDFVIATGALHSVREFVREAFECLNLRWEDYVVEDPKFYRPAKPIPLAGDASKAHRQLGWLPEYDFRSLVQEMVEEDLRIASAALKQ